MKKILLFINLIIYLTTYSQEKIQSLDEKIKVYYKSLDEQIIESSVKDCNLEIVYKYKDAFFGLTKNKIDLSKIISMQIMSYQSDTEDTFYYLTIYLKDDALEYEAFANINDYKSNILWKKGTNDKISIITVKKRRDLVVKFQEIILELAELCGSQNIINFD